MNELVQGDSPRNKTTQLDQYLLSALIHSHSWNVIIFNTNATDIGINFMIEHETTIQLLDKLFRIVHESIGLCYVKFVVE